MRIKVRDLTAVVAGLALLFACSQAASADPILLASSGDRLIIDTTGADGPGPLTLGAFGEPGAATLGQTFVAPPAAHQVDRFTIYLQFVGAEPDVAGGPARLAGYLAGWDGVKATGPVLYASGERQLTTTGVVIPMTFETGGVPVTPGGRYVAFLSASGFFDHLIDSTNFFGEGDTYGGGELVVLDNGNDFPQVFTSEWQLGLGPGFEDLDLGFVAEFTPVPEPSTLMLLGTGMTGVAAALRRRRKAVAESMS